jgi:putative ABC transport system substrate-binding protein
MPAAALAQQRAQRPLMAFLDGKSQAAGQALTDAFLQGLGEFGYEPGRNVEIVYRFADGRDERLPGMAAELVRLKPSVIIAPGVNAVVAAHRVTKTIPILSWALADAIHLGLAKSYAQPGGNVTGITPYVDGLPAKQLELAREVVPAASRVGILGNMNDPKAPPQRQELEDAARSLKVEAVFSELRNPDGLEAAVRALARESVRVVIVLQTAMTLSERRGIATAALANGLPTVFGYRENVVDGGLVSYGVSLRWCSHRLAGYVHKVLQGASPAGLPIELPTRLELVANARTAKALGLSIPKQLAMRSDELIE